MMRGRKRRKRFLELRNVQLSMIRHWQYHSRKTLEFSEERAEEFAHNAGLEAWKLAHEAIKLSEKDWKILLK